MIKHVGISRQKVGTVAYRLDGLPVREALALVAKRPGMYTGRPRFNLMVVFIQGVDFAETRNGGELLAGFSAWMEETRGVRHNELGWPHQVLRAAFPGQDVRPHLVADGQHDHAITTLFALLDAYLAEREDAGTLPG